MRNRTAFDDLREYVAGIIGRKIKNDDIYVQAAMSDSKFSKILKGPNDFTVEEAKKIADIFFELGKDKAELDVLCRKLSIFLSDYYDESMVEAYLTKLKRNTNKRSTLPRIAEDAEIIRKATEKEIKESIELNKISFCYGSKNIGKSFIAKIIAHQYYDSNICNVAIWNDCREINTFEAFLSNFVLFIPNLINSDLSISEKEKTVKNFLADNTVILVIDNFDDCIDDKEKDSILLFLAKTQNTKIIIISEKEMKNYKPCLNNQDIFSETKIRPIRKDEWNEYVEIRCKISDQVNEVVKNYPDLIDDLYEYCGKNPTMLIEEFNRICKIYGSGEKSYSKVEESLQYLGSTSFDLLFKNLTIESRYLLITLSCFKNPVSLDFISKITGIPEASTMATNLIDAYDECMDYHFIIEDDDAELSLRTDLRSVIKKEREKYPEYQNILKRIEVFYKDINKKDLHGLDSLER